ncbi:hypothetical protein K1X76_12200 [bacterium]|nr:hypothetical protein [bacterium]
MENTLQLFYDTTPPLPGVYWNLLRRQFKNFNTKEMPLLDGEILSVKTNPIKLIRYQEVCGLTKSRYLPLLYPNILASSLHGQLLTLPLFPFNALGLIHTHTTIHQYRPIHYTETLNITAHLGNYVDNEKGTFFDITTTVAIRHEVAWQGIARILAKRKKYTKVHKDILQNFEHETIVKVPGTIGLQYAFVSGDFNPIHLANPLAWIFGFKRAIAHGNWLLAKSLAAIFPKANNRSLILEASFKKPVMTGSNVNLMWDHAKNFLLHHNKKPHLIGKVEEI